LFRNGNAVDLNTLGWLDEVGRRVKAGPEAGMAQRIAHHGRSRALAVGAGDVDEALPAFGIAEFGEERLHAFESPLFADTEFVAERVEKANGVEVTHCSDWVCDRAAAGR
jgi:hypothetical protein